ncbi:MAG: minor capsid protein [Magnetococcales bacterium]|nr:minor capsid protein [Magnetococcales bacterium]
MADPQSPLLLSPQLRPERAVDYLRQKKPRLSWRGGELSAAEHAHNFTVAKAGSLDILETIRNGLIQALELGQTEKWFVDRMTPILQAKGWWGSKTVINPQGVEEEVQLGSLPRLHTIFQTNIWAAYNAGRYAAQRETADFAPWLKYVAVMDARTRPAHAAMNGLVFHINDPIWETCYPPCDYNCRCTTVAYSDAMLRQYGHRPFSSEGRALSVARVVGHDPATQAPIFRTVTGYRIPKPGGGEIIFAPRPGFDSNPAGAWPRYDFGNTFTDQTFAPGQKTWRDYGRPDARELKAVAWPKAAELPVDPLTALRAVFQVSATQPLREIATPVKPAVVHDSLLAKMAAEMPPHLAAAIPTLPDTLATPLEVWLAADAASVFRRHFLAFYRQPDASSPFAVLVKEGQDGFLAWEVRTDPEEINSLRVGGLIHPSSPTREND